MGDLREWDWKDLGGGVTPVTVVVSGPGRRQGCQADVPQPRAALHHFLLTYSTSRMPGRLASQCAQVLELQRAFTLAKLICFFDPPSSCVVALASLSLCPFDGQGN